MGDKCCAWRCADPRTVQDNHLGHCGYHRRDCVPANGGALPFRRSSQVKRWQGELIRVLIILLLSIACWLVTPGCTNEQLAAYQSHVESRSVEGYGKESTNGTTSGGVKYTVRYK